MTSNVSGLIKAGAVGGLGLAPYVLGAALTSWGFTRGRGVGGRVPENRARQAGDPLVPG
jgi:hypothetical protein